MQRRIQFELLLDDRHQHVDADGDPDPRSHGVLRGAPRAAQIEHVCSLTAAVTIHDAMEGLPGRKSVSCANSILPVFIGASHQGKRAGSRKQASTVAIGDTPPTASKRAPVLAFKPIPRYLTEQYWVEITTL